MPEWMRSKNARSSVRKMPPPRTTGTGSALNTQASDRGGSHDGDLVGLPVDQGTRNRITVPGSPEDGRCKFGEPVGVEPAEVEGLHHVPRAAETEMRRHETDERRSTTASIAGPEGVP